MNFPWFKLASNERVAAPILLRELGVLTSLRVGRRIRRFERAGEPFCHLGEPDGEDDARSRAQIGPAILLYRVLLDVCDQEVAYRITQEIVIEAAVIFLRETIGSLRRADLDGLDEDAKAAFAQDRGDRFFNASVVWDHLGSDEVRFTVTHCRFPPLCAAAGVPELAPIFCEGDRKFFGTVEPDVLLDRPETIALGGSRCSFRLHYRDREP